MACPTGKRAYETITLAEDALIELWSKNDYRPGLGPIAIYKCEDCGDYHFTSKGEMNDKLAKAISSGEIARLRRAGDWERRLGKNR